MSPALRPAGLGNRDPGESRTLQPLTGRGHATRPPELLEETTGRNGHWFDTEMDKLDRWAEDRRDSLKAELAELDEALKEAKKSARLAPNLPEEA